MNLLKQSTTVTIRLGPFLDASNGVDEETALSLVATDIQVSKDHAAFANKNDATAPTHDSDGWYTCVLDATDTGTVGHLIVKSQDSATHMAVYIHYTVVSANVYDSLVADTDKLQTDAVEWLGTTPLTMVSQRIQTHPIDTIQVTPMVPISIDLADTATYRLGLMLTDQIDDLPTVAQITPGTISIDRKAIGGTSWTAVVTDAACTEQDGQIYYDEVFDSGTGYVEGDSIRITFKSQDVVASSNTFAISDSNGRIFYTEIRQTERGTNSAATAANVNSEVLDVLTVDTFAQPGQATPPATLSLKDMWTYLYKAWRNKSDQSATTYQLYNDDASTVDQKAGVSEASGTVTKNEVTTGP